jgi:hypothetical protein
MSSDISFFPDIAAIQYIIHSSSCHTFHLVDISQYVFERSSYSLLNHEIECLGYMTEIFSSCLM